MHTVAAAVGLQLMCRDDCERTTDWGTVDGTTLKGAEAGLLVGQVEFW